MQKPLWKFFTLLKARTPLLLSVDQYAYFLAAFQQTPTAHFKNYYDLRDFCKIFWLKDYEYEAEFDHLFARLLVWEELQSLLKTEGKEENKDQHTDNRTSNRQSQGGGEQRNSKEEEGDKKEEDKKGDDDQANAETDDEAFVDFELMIKEQQQSTNPAAEAGAYSFEYSFQLNDQAIMPFELRHFAQRLRRQVETSVKVPTRELDYDRMIIQYSKYRYIDEIVYKLRDSSWSNIVLLSDRFGSMLAYEYIEKQLVLSIKAIPDCTFEHYFFYNLPERLSSGTYLLKNAGTGKPQLDTQKHKWTSDTWFFLLSDGGAHSGMVNRGRISATFNFWNYLKGISPHVYWLNPVPPQYLKGSTAQRLNLVIPMTYPTKDELKKFFQEL